ncbi:hypothetical protein [uncultured Desulfobulbus sp.]|uniref:hypothetical protein n=1 Tax=uncultured Desulfobulbus sp. TaxID=239745 RepID=UPI0029C86868|nr:hypothetical protein [uncultured Desulfobulbus sp.]
MKYSYGNRRYSLGKPITTNWLILIIFIPHIIRDLFKSFKLPELAWIEPITTVTWVVALIWLIVRVIRYYRPKNCPDLPSAIEITDTGVLRLFHGQQKYAEIPIDQIASLKDTTLDINAVESDKCLSTDIKNSDSGNRPHLCSTLS